MTLNEVRQLEEQFLGKIKVLSETVWEGKANGPQVKHWLGNFSGRVASTDDERMHMLYLLTQFMYYGRRETRALLEAIYFDLFRYPIIAEIRRANGNTKDSGLIAQAFESELNATRFIGLGGAADSGTMLLYELRKQLKLGSHLFATVDAVLSGRREHSPPAVKRYVFIDDLCGSGEEATDFNAEIVEPIRALLGTDVEIDCFVLFGTSAALASLRPPATGFNRVEAVHELDDTFKSLGPNSRYFPSDPLEKDLARRIAERYGMPLFGASLGHGACELLLGFTHNIPDNTLPIIWSKEAAWKPIFERR